MTLREKLAWILMSLIIVCFGVYFVTLAYAWRTGQIVPGYFGGLFVATVLTLTIGSIIAATVLGILYHRDANKVPDERERRIAERASSRSYYILLTGSMLVAGGVFYNISSFMLANALLFVVCIAEISHFAFGLYYYRRGLVL